MTPDCSPRHYMVVIRPISNGGAQLGSYEARWNFLKASRAFFSSRHKCAAKEPHKKKNSSRPRFLKLNVLGIIVHSSMLSWAVCT
jgi:hypothetical protein